MDQRQVDTVPQLLFDGRRRVLFRLVLTNLLLTVVTLGIYRFWAKTRIRRFFWRHVTVLGEPLEYLGTGAELWKGFLLAILILVPLFGTYSLLNLGLIDQAAGGPVLLEIGYFLIIFFLVQMVIHRVRRYRLTRTAWRGVRFGLEGSSLRYAVLSSAYAILTLFTLGFAYPWLRVATLRYFVRNAWFGSARLSLEASPGWLFRRWLLVVGPAVIALAALLVLNTPFAADLVELTARSADGGPISEDSPGVFASEMTVWPLPLFGISMVAWIWYRVVEFRHLVGHSRMGAIAFSSRLAARDVYLIHIGFWMLLLFTVTAIMVVSWPLAVAVSDALSVSSTVLVSVVVAVLLLTVVYGDLRLIFLDMALLKAVCATLHVDNVAQFETVVQSKAAGPSHGEGLADALDVGGF